MSENYLTMYTHHTHTPQGTYACIEKKEHDAISKKNTNDMNRFDK